ncbi:MAG: succinyl-CoA--3-ketoacid-CoA transferase [Acidobacteria bacterium RIFCSPLOWO2_02_FULL_61_28]|nr:MAG: succinyl-CoA--3-ketoacid-CoA transferase [Acidobacteria bacterium RIFCSPLOWO2_02_FULL_61_28]
MTLTREGIAYRVARDLTEGSYVNLGVGIPSLVPAYLPSDREIFIHNENGVLGVGPLAAPGAEDPDLVSANKEFITLLPGASVFDHAISFSMIRGGHLTHAVMGAMEVAANGDLANWRVPGQKVPGVGGAMDLAFGVQNVWIAMTHVTNKGEPKILTRCSCPLTAPRCVRRIFTDIAVIDVTPDGLMLREVARGLEPEAVRARTGAPLRVADDCREMDVPAAFNGVQLTI